MQTKTPGQIAYEADCEKRPHSTIANNLQNGPERDFALECFKTARAAIVQAEAAGITAKDA